MGLRSFSSRSSRGADLLDIFGGVGVRAEEEFVEQLFVRFGEVGLVLDVFSLISGAAVLLMPAW